ncbi:hypothetical protein AB4562_08830 [Vibrio sp. 10N.222.54.A1]|uniref:hypothetical protein n=1 Tax=unclassified Vibrio TaxID=2614977 RepID=UPI00352DF3B5
MLAFLKKWRQAYREEKGDRLHAEVEAERNAISQAEAISVNDVNRAFSELGQGDRLKRFAANFCEAASEAMEESLEEDVRGRKRYY